jgi:hypothetical protein
MKYNFNTPLKNTLNILLINTTMSNDLQLTFSL